MSDLRVEERIMQYTEVVYFDGDVEVAREERADVSWFDTAVVREPTPDEVEDYYPGESS